MAELPRLVSAKDMAEALYLSGAVRVGKTPEEFPMTNGGRTGVKWDVEQVEHQPDHQNTVINAFEDGLYTFRIKYKSQINRLLGVPNGMNHMTGLLAARIYMRHLLLNKEEVQRGNAQLYGANSPSEIYDIQLLEDVLTSGKSVFDSADAVQREQGIRPFGVAHRLSGVTGLITRNEHAVEALGDKLRRPVHAMYTSVELGEALKLSGHINEEQLSWIEADFKKPLATY